MPIYCFTCENCGEFFEIHCSMNKISSTKPNCDICGSNDVYREWRSEEAYSKPPIKTLGSLMDKNTDEFSEDKKQHLLAEQRKITRGKSQFEGVKKYDGTP